MGKHLLPPSVPGRTVHRLHVVLLTPHAQCLVAGEIVFEDVADFLLHTSKTAAPSFTIPEPNPADIRRARKHQETHAFTQQEGAMQIDATEPPGHPIDLWLSI